MKLDALKAKKNLDKKEAAVQQTLIDMLLGNMQGGIVSADVGQGQQSFDVPQGATQAPQGQPTGQPSLQGPQGGFPLNPQQLALAKMGGIDLTSVASLATRQDRNRALAEEAAARLGVSKRTAAAAEQRAESGDIESITQTRPGEGKFSLRRRKSTGEILTDGKGLKIEPAKRDMPIPSDKIPLWVHPDDLSNPKYGTSHAKAEQEGFLPVTATMRNNLVAVGGAMKIASEVANLVDRVFPDDETVLERLRGGGERAISAWAQSNVEAAELRDTIKGTLAPIIRSLGEKGALSDGDVSRAINLLPKLTDGASLARRKMMRVMRILETQKNLTLGVGINISSEASDFLKNKGL